MNLRRQKVLVEQAFRRRLDQRTRFLDSQQIRIMWLSEHWIHLTFIAIYLSILVHHARCGRR